MRVTISRTINLDDVPEEIDEVFGVIISRLIMAKEKASNAADSAREGRYVDASKGIEGIREALVILDKNLEEQQSLCLSYEKIRIANQMPEQAHSSQLEVPENE